MPEMRNAHPDKNKQEWNEPVFAGTGQSRDEGKYFGTGVLILPLLLISISLHALEWHLTFTFPLILSPTFPLRFRHFLPAYEKLLLHAPGYTYSFCVGCEIVYLCALWCNCHQCHFHLGVQLFMPPNALKLQTLIPSFCSQWHPNMYTNVVPMPESFICIHLWALQEKLWSMKRFLLSNRCVGSRM